MVGHGPLPTLVNRAQHAEHVIRTDVACEVIAPEERLSIMQALELFTRNPAYIGFEEKQKGSLEAGKFADFIVIDRDVLTIPPDQLKDVQVLQTWVGGEMIYEKH